MTVRRQKSERESGFSPWVSGAAIKYLRENDLPTMNTHYNIPAALVARWENALAAVGAVRVEYEDGQSEEIWMAYETLESTYKDALYDLLEAWLAAWRAEPVPVAVEAGLWEDDYEAAARRFRLRAELSRAIENAYVDLGYGGATTGDFYGEQRRMEAMAAECEAYVAARREQAEAEAERERLLVDWGRVPVAERKSSHPNFRARVDCCRRSEEARQRWFLSPLYAHELSIEARRLWLTLEPALHIARQMGGGVTGVVAADMRRRCVEAGPAGEAVIRYAGLA
jgi:hypothetical protein